VTLELGPSLRQRERLLVEALLPIALTQ